MRKEEGVVCRGTGQSSVRESRKRKRGKGTFFLASALVVSLERLQFLLSFLNCVLETEQHCSISADLRSSSEAQSRKRREDLLIGITHTFSWDESVRHPKLLEQMNEFLYVRGG
jgi:hypothetical protein